MKASASQRRELDVFYESFYILLNMIRDNAQMVVLHLNLEPNLDATGTWWNKRGCHGRTGTRRPLHWNLRKPRVLRTLWNLPELTWKWMWMNLPEPDVDATPEPSKTAEPSGPSSGTEVALHRNRAGLHCIANKALLLGKSRVKRTQFKPSHVTANQLYKHACHRMSLCLSDIEKSHDIQEHK